LKSIDRFTHRLARVRFLPEVLALLGVLAYLIHAWGHVHGQVSVLDEGLYLFKGYQFALGNYQPFQDYGPLTNHMPLSFLIPGWVQVLFGTGLRTARYYALSLGSLLVVGLWVASRRFASPWLAAIGVWAVALNPALVKIYSQATSQVLVTAMLIWALAFTLGDGRKPWQLFLGTLLGGLIALTRINMFPFLPLLIAYIFWQHGRKSGYWSLITGVMVVLLGHAVYWPDILKLWSKWMPASMTPFLNSFRETAGGEPVWGPVNFPGNRFWILFSSLRMHLLSALGLIIFWLVFQFDSNNREGKTDLKIGLFLSVLYLTLMTMHIWASLGLEYCPFCLENYFAFFHLVGLLLFILAGKYALRRTSSFRRVALVLVLVVVPIVFGVTLDSGISELLLETQVPRLSNLRLEPGTISLLDTIGGKFSLTSDIIITWTSLLLNVFMIGFALVFLYYAVMAVCNRERFVKRNYLGAFLGVFIGIELALATIVFGNTYRSYDCGKDIITAHESVGEYLTARIPADSLVYWGVGRSPVPLLYLSNVKIFPPQLNGDYTLRGGGDSDELLRFGYWNDQLAINWLASADYIMVEKRNYSSTVAEFLDPSHYDEFEATAPTDPCREDSSILVFRRIP
jgi:hypothetical protein